MSEMMEDFVNKMYSDPNEFVLSSHSVAHKPSGVSVWVRSSWLFYSWYHPVEMSIPFMDKVYFRRALKDLIARNIRVGRKGR